MAKEHLIIHKNDILNLTKKEVQKMDIGTMYQYAIKAVNCRLVESFNNRIGNNYGIPSNYVASILKGEKEGKKFRNQVETSFKSMFLQFIDSL